MDTITLLSIGLVAYLIFKYLSRKISKYPPGPLFQAPILGDLIYLGERPWETCLQWKEKYGDIISLQLGSYRCVILNSYEVIKDAFSQSVFSGRPDLPAMNLPSGGKNGIVSSEGHQWMEQRRFTLRHLRDFGFGKKSLERVIQDEVAELLENLSKDSLNPINLNHRFNLAILNVLWQIIAGERFSQHDPKLNKLLIELKEGLQSLSGLGVATFVPRLANMAPELFGWKRFAEVTDKSRNFYTGKILEHENTFDSNEPRDFIDAYLKEINSASDCESSFYNNTGRDNLLAILAGLFVAGSETTALTLTWMTLYLGLHLDAQKKLQLEIDSVVGKSRHPSLEDRPRMPYTEALIAETFRMSSVNQFGGFHRATEDTEFKGYKILKDTVLVPNQWAVHHDPTVWGDPENFRPERFLSPDKLRFIKKDGILTFSTGKRSCIGEPLARDELFIFTTSIYQRFNITLNDKEPKPTMRPVLSVLATPEHFTVIIRERD